MLAARRARVTTHSPSISSGPCLGRLLPRALLARGRLLGSRERLVAASALATARGLALLRLLDRRLERGHEVDDRGLGLRLGGFDDLALLDLGLDDLHDRLLVFVLELVRLELHRHHADEVLGRLQRSEAHTSEL